MKEEEAAFKETGFSREMAETLKQNFSETHDLAKPSDQHLFWFYKNTLRERYIQAGRRLKLAYIRAAVGDPLTPKLRSIAVHLLTSYLTPYSFEDEELTVERARALMEEKPWLRFPWWEAIPAAEDWIKTHPGNHSYTDISRCLASRSFGPEWTWSDHQRLALALTRVRKPGACCSSNPGCLNCPNNRLWTRAGGDIVPH